MEVSVGLLVQAQILQGSLCLGDTSRQIDTNPPPAAVCSVQDAVKALAVHPSRPVVAAALGKWAGRCIRTSTFVNCTDRSNGRLLSAFLAKSTWQTLHTAICHLLQDQATFASGGCGPAHVVEHGT